MPELPEVETIRRGLTPLIVKKKIVQVEVDPTTKKAFQGDEGNVVDASVSEVRRRGKALLIDLDNGYTMMIHLRMTGQLIWRGANEEDNFAAGHPSKNFTDALPNKQTRVNFVFEEGVLYFNDQRKFGFVKVLPTGKLNKKSSLRSSQKSHGRWM